jgi:hypothetical protein
MDLTEFRGRVCEALIEIREVCEANPAVAQQALPSDLCELLSIVRTAASELILCSSVREAIDRLKRDRLALGAVEYVSSSGLSDDEIEAAMRLAYEKRAGDTPDLPCFAFCSYLIELCNGLEPGKGPHKT